MPSTTFKSTFAFISVPSEIISDHLSILHDEQDSLELGYVGYGVACFSNREIGEMLGLTEGTVKNHVSRLLLKLDARDRISAVLKAIASRLA